MCLRIVGYSVSLDVRKLYPVLENSDAGANDLIRVIDESGEDYLYPKNYFVLIELTQAAQKALLSAA